MWTFFYELMSEDEEITIFLITILAIFTSGDIRDQSFLIIIGESNNGKSLLIKLLSWLLGSTSSEVPPGVFFTSFIQEAANDHTSHLDTLKELRIGHLVETNPGRILSSDNIKKITAGETIRNRPAFERKFQHMITSCHLILASQHLPQMDISDQGMMKRARVVNFRSWFKPKNPTNSNPNALKIYEEDKKLEEHLNTPECLDALFTMFSIAAHQYYVNKYEYHISQQVHDNLKNYSEDSFVYADFIEELCIVCDPKTTKILSKELHEYYMKGHGDNNKIFKKNMERRFRYGKSTGGNYYYHGINIDVKKLNMFNSRVSDLNYNIWQQEQQQRKYLTLNVIPQSKNAKTLEDLGYQSKTSKDFIDICTDKIHQGSKEFIDKYMEL